MSAAVDKAPKSREAKSGRERILDAAEVLFAQHGFDGVSVRDITEAASVDVALISYHFGGKRELFASLFQRRAEELNAARAVSLEAALAAAGPATPPIEAVLECYLQPMWHLAATGDPGWRHFFQIVAQVNNSPHWAPILMSRHFDAGAEKLVGLIHAALPAAPPAEIYWAVQFLAGSLTMTFAQTGRIDRFSGGACSSTDLQAALGRLVRYSAAGIRALAAPAGALPAPPVPNSAKVTPKVDIKPLKAANTRKKRT